MNLIYPLASSSKGNAIYLGSTEHGILLDCGIGIRTLKNALMLHDIPLSAVEAVFITHEHSDHIKGLYKLSENIPVTIYGNVPTLKEVIAKRAVGPKAKLKEIDQKPAAVCGMAVRAFHTSHDSADSRGYHITFPDGKRFCLSTDLGFVSDEVHENLLDSDFVMLESNYEEELLINGSYPSFLKARIKGSRGHLSNADCAAELELLAKSGISQFILGHLSEENNLPQMALAASVNRLAGCGLEISRDYSLMVAPRATTGKAVFL